LNKLDLKVTIAISRHRSGEPFQNVQMQAM